MQALSGPAGLNNALNTVSGTKLPGPPDHAKAWGWRAKQPAAIEAQLPVATPEAAPKEATEGTTGTPLVTEPEAVSEAPPPSEADMESVILALITDFGESSGTDTQPLYEEVQALFA